MRRMRARARSWRSAAPPRTCSRCSPTNLDQGLDRERIAEALAILTTESAALAAERYLVRPIRARILPAGAAILDAILERYGVDRLRVSEAGIREGAILAVDHAGRAWRDRLAQLAHGWRS